MPDEARISPAAGRPALYGILITYRRPGAFRKIVARLMEQTRPLDRLVVVDNEPSPEVEESLAGYRASGRRADYVAAPENLGPAGGIALGMRTLLASAGDDDWVVLLDDDDPPAAGDALSQVERFAHGAMSSDERTAGVGVSGARFDWRRGRPVRLPDRDLEGAVPVDYVGGNKLPTYRVGAIRETGPFRGDLFFGFDDLEFGLRLQRAGFALYVDGERWLERRTDRGRIGISPEPSLELGAVTWRRYYSLRNVIWILRSHGRSWTAARVALTVGFGKPLLQLPRSPGLALRHLWINWRACLDGWRGRMGRTLEPEAPAVEATVGG